MIHHQISITICNGVCCMLSTTLFHIDGSLSTESSSSQLLARNVFMKMLFCTFKIDTYRY